MDVSHREICVAVLSGGEGEERQISLESGECVFEALEKSKFKVIQSDITSADMSILDNDEVDVFFLALHGKFGEDGQLQEILERRKLKYTGSGPVASRVSFDKIESKKIFDKKGIPTPKWIEVSKYMETKELSEKITELGNKYILKPSQQGSSVGIEILEDSLLTAKAATVCLARFGPCLIEEFISGRELTVGIIDQTALPIIEIVPKDGFYNYDAKYISNNTQYLFDTIENKRLCREIQTIALDCFNALGCRHFGRVDLLLDKDLKPYVLEINTLPGMTSHSLLPKAAQKEGMDMTGLCTKIIEQALLSE